MGTARSVASPPPGFVVDEPPPEGFVVDDASPSPKQKPEVAPPKKKVDFNAKNRNRAGLDPSRVNYGPEGFFENVVAIPDALTHPAEIGRGAVAGVVTGTLPSIGAGRVEVASEQQRRGVPLSVRAGASRMLPLRYMVGDDLPAEERAALKQEGTKKLEVAVEKALPTPTSDPGAQAAHNIGKFVGGVADPVFALQPEAKLPAVLDRAIAKFIPGLAGSVTRYLAKNAVNVPVDVVAGTLTELARGHEVDLSPKAIAKNGGVAFVARNVLGLLHVKRAKTPALEDIDSAAAATRDASSLDAAPAASTTSPAAEPQTGATRAEFTAPNIQRTFNFSREQSVATEALADAMGLDKSKISLSRGGQSSDALLQSGDRWYSDNIQSALESWQAKGTPEQLLAHLKKTKGALDEAKTIGLNEWLGSKPSVTRDEVRQFLDQNRVDVVDVTPSSSELSDVYKEYTVPGGDNYREILLTLPERKGEPFVQQHFPDHPNVVAHLRLKDRTLPDGRKALFVEEMQSDWHQSGRKEGYYDPSKPWEVVTGRAELSPEMVEEARALGFGPDRRATVVGEYATEAEAHAAARGAGESVRHASEGMRPPDAPFKGEGWKRLALKRVLALAAEKDYDAVAWSTGTSHAARYEYGASVEGGHWDAVRDGVRRIWLDTPGGEPLRFSVTEDGRIVGAKGTAQHFGHIDDVLPPALIDRIRSRPEGTFTDRFDVGLGGMKGFYDRELPNIANDLVKPYGTKAKRGKIKQSFDVFDTRTGDVLATVESEAEAERAAEKFGAHVDYNRALSWHDDDAHIIDVSPEMRETIRTKKLPLFQGEKGAVDFVDGGQAVIHALASADVSTAVHELAHVGRRFLFDRSVPAEQRFGISDADIATAESWAGVKDGTWDRAAEEKFARGFERYLLDGHAPSNELRSLFAKFKEWLGRIYTRITGSDVDVQISDEMRKVFDRLVQRDAKSIEIAPKAVKPRADGGEWDIPKASPARSSIMSTPAVGTEHATTSDGGLDVDAYVREQIEKREAARRTGEPSMEDRLRNLLASAKAKVVDFAAPIEDTLAKAVREHDLKLRPSAEITNQIDRALRAPSLAGQFARDAGIEAVIHDVPDLQKLDQYLIAKHAIAVEERGVTTGRDIAKDKLLVEALDATYAPFAKRVTDYSRALLDYAVDAGLVDKDLAENLKEIYPDYVPLQRVFAEIEKSDGHFGGGKGIASLSSQTILRKLSGSTREIENPLESLLAKTNDSFLQGEKNKAARMLISYQTLPGNPFQLRKLNAGESAPHTVSFLAGGKKITYATTKEVAAAAKALDVQQMDIWTKILATPVRIARAGITGYNAPFLFANLAKDQVTAAINSNRALATSIANPVNFMRALFTAVKHGPLFDELVREGGHGTSFDISREQAGASLERMRAERSVASKIAYNVRHVGELARAVEDILARGEEITRIQQYAGMRDQLVKEGMPLRQARIAAARAARENTVNFARRGEWGTVLNSAVLYLNANIQGTRALLRTIKRNPAGAAVKISTVLFPMTVMTAWNLGDPDRRKVYEDIAPFEKENNMIIVPPNATKDERGRWNVIKIPMSQEITGIASVPRRVIEQMFGLDAVRAGEVAEALYNTISPSKWGAWETLSTVTPQAIKPFAETMANTNFFTGLELVPAKLAKKRVERQVKPYTSGTARKVGAAIDVSPIKVEHFVRATAGGLGSQALNASDHALAALGFIPATQIGGEDIIEGTSRRFTKAFGGESARKARTKKR